MRPITVSEYQSLEAEARKRLSFRAVNAFTSLQMGASPLPRVSDDTELWKFIDAGGEAHFISRFKSVLGGAISQREFETLQALLALYCDVAETWFERPLLPRGSALQGLSTLRHIRFLYDNTPARTLCIGSGAGHLALLLLISGYPCTAVDMSQALYLLNNRAWSLLATGRYFERPAEAEVFECISHSDLSHAINCLAPFKGSHIPWWKFATLRPNTIPQYDLVVLGEEVPHLHVDGIKFILRIAHASLKQRDSLDLSLKTLVIENPSNLSPALQEQFAQLLAECGFEIAHVDSNFIICAPRSTETAASSATYALVPHSEDHLLSRLVTQHTTALFGQYGEAVIGTAQLEALYTVLLGSTDHASADEEFLRVIGAA